MAIEEDGCQPLLDVLVKRTQEKLSHNVDQRVNLMCPLTKLLP